MRILCVLLFLVPSLCCAAPVAIAEGDGIKLTLTDEPCKLEAVTNLKGRAEWVTKDKTYEGCWGSALNGQVIVIYFDDKTATALPAQMFKRVSGT